MYLRLLFIYLFLFVHISKAQIINYGDNEDDQIDTIGETYSPTLDDSEDGYRQYIESNLILPNNVLNTSSVMEVIVSFTVKKDSSIRRFKIEKNTHPQINLYLEQIHVLMPDWEPGMVDGEIKNLKVYYGFRITRRNKYDITVEKLEIPDYKGKKLSRNLKIIITSTALAIATYLLFFK